MNATFRINGDIIKFQSKKNSFGWGTIVCKVDGDKSAYFNFITRESSLIEFLEKKMTDNLPLQRCTLTGTIEKSKNKNTGYFELVLVARDV